MTGGDVAQATKTSRTYTVTGLTVGTKVNIDLVDPTKITAGTFTLDTAKRVADLTAPAAAVLWTGEPAACLSHDSALAAYEVCDINPDRIHLTVPRARRIRRSGGDLYVIHHQDLAAEQVGWWQQIPTATLPTAMAQCVATGVPGYLLRQGLTTGRARGELSAADVDTLERALEARDAGR